MIILRLFICELAYIPSESMNPTLETGDYIIYEKCTYGAKHPNSISEIPWTNSLLLLSIKYNEFLNKNRWTNNRLFYGKAPHRNDIVVFKSFEDSFFIKRCVGLPGDTINQTKGLVFCNGIFTDTIKSIHQQLILNDISDNLIHLCNQNDIPIHTIVYQGVIHKYASISSILLYKLNINRNSENNKLFNSFSEKQFLNEGYINNFEDLYIPQKGSRIELNATFIRKYASIISKYEGHSLEIKDDRILLDGIETDTYTFKKDYYFFLGDNRSNSIDSRSFGLIPFESIVGKAQFILFSKNKDTGFVWDRLFKKLH